MADRVAEAIEVAREWAAAYEAVPPLGALSRAGPLYEIIEILGEAAAAPADAFEAWLMAKWLREIRMDAFRQSADYEHLLAEWERR